MPPRRRGCVVLVCSSRVKHVLVTQPLDVADVEDHVQAKPHARIFEDLEGFRLGGRERRDAAGVGEAGQRADVVGIPFAVDSAIKAGLDVQDLRSDKYVMLSANHPQLQMHVLHVLILTLAHFALAVKVPNRLRQSLDHVWSLLLHGVVHVMHTRDVTLPAFQRFVHAQ